MSDKIRHYDETGQDVTAQVEANAAIGAVPFTLRDFFAGCALTGLLSLPTEVWGPKGLAESALGFADAMLKAREAE